MINRKIALTLLAGVTLGAAGASALMADTPPVPKGYVIAEINVTDLDGYRAYGEKAFPVIQQYGGKFLTRGGATVPVEGPPPAQRVMIIEFESFEQAKKFEYSKEYTAIAPLRNSTSESRIYLLEGTADAAKSAP